MMIGKIILILGVFSAFLILSTGTELQGWSGFATFLSGDPFEGVPKWPEFGQPATNITVGDLFLRDASYSPFGDDCDESKTLSLSAGASVETVILSPGELGCWAYPVSEISFNAGDWERHLWLTASVSGDRIDSSYVNADSQSFFWFLEERCSVSTIVTVSGEYTVPCTLDGWSFVSNRVLVLLIRPFLSNTGTITVSYGDPTVESRIIPPDWTQSSTSECSWNPGTWGGCVSGTIDWIGSAFLYIGGILWVVLNYVGFAIAWILGFLISFFGAVIGMLVYMVGGAGVPPPASYLFQITFVTFLGIIIFTIISLILGRASNAG